MTYYKMTFLHCIKSIWLSFAYIKIIALQHIESEFHVNSEVCSTSLQEPETFNSKHQKITEEK